MLVLLAVTSEIAGTGKFFNSRVPKVLPADAPKRYSPTFLQNPASGN
ncbi:MAG: hypothetical protein P4M06_08815 [Pandoraea sp.]|nr:hypothetical protein [Pandoraea sp.]MDR3397648.1 hypothetical protein [Pandoraea sp.]